MDGLGGGAGSLWVRMSGEEGLLLQTACSQLLESPLRVSQELVVRELWPTPSGRSWGFISGSREEQARLAAEWAVCGLLVTASCAIAVSPPPCTLPLGLGGPQDCPPQPRPSPVRRPAQPCCCLHRPRAQACQPASCMGRPALEPESRPWL